MIKSLGVAFTGLALALGCVGTATAQSTLNVAIGSNLNTLDPNVVRIGEEYVYNGLVFNGLVRIGADGKLEPDLATNWTASEDLKTWIFELRQGVKFHSGKELVAEDVVATVKHVLDPGVGSTARTNLGMIAETKTLDKYTVEFTLTQPYAGFADLFAEHQMRIAPADKIGQMGSTPDGTGPFKLESYTPGDRMTLLKHSEYFREGLPHLDRVVMRIIPEMAAQVVALRSGDVDLAWNIPPEAVSLLASESDIRIDMTPTGAWDGVIMNNQVAPFDNVKVRKAVAAALDKKALVDAVLFGQGTVTVTPIPANSPYFNKDVNIKGGDYDEAKRLLEEAGFANGLDVTMYLPIGRPTRERLGVVAAELLKSANIRVKLQRVPWDQFTKEVEGKAGFYADGFFSRSTVDTSIYPFYHSTGSWNAGLWNYRNEEVDKLLDQARMVTNEDERAKLYQQFQAVVMEDVPSLIAYNQNHSNAVGRKVNGFKSSPLLLLNLEHVSLDP